jgi:hypothetical protein
MIAAACSLQQPATRPEPGIELPPGPGRDLLVDACLGCHDLGGIELFAAFYSREQWHELVTTMVAHGADLDSDEVDMLAGYLDEHYGAN